MEWLEVPDIRDRWLHRRSGNSLRGREGDDWFRGALGEGLEPGPHNLEIAASDFSGNTTLVNIPLLVADIEYPQPPLRGSWVESPVSIARDSLPDNNLHPFLEVNHKPLGLLYLSKEEGFPVLAPTFLAAIQGQLDMPQREQAVLQGLKSGFNSSNEPSSH